MDAENYLARGFRDVDAAATGKMVRCLEYLDSLPQFRQYKMQILELMHPRPESITADLGCGLGFDVRRLAARVGPEGTALGVDSSRSLLAAARSASQSFASAEYVQADIRHLPFADGLLGSCKIDRVLQHVEQPDAVLREIFRTVTAGGCVVCAEPDWGTFAIEDDSKIAHEIAQRWAESFQNPRIGSQLRGRLEAVGFVQLRAQEWVLSTDTFASSDEVFDISQSAMRLAASSGDREPLTWLSRLRALAGPIRCSVKLFINLGIRP